MSEGRMKEVHNRLFSKVAQIPGRITALFRGRAAQRSVEAALQESGVRLQLVQELAGAGIWEWKRQTGEMTWDAWVSQLLGLDPVKDPASCQTWNRVLHPDDRQSAHSEMERVLQERNTFNREFRVIRPDGQVRWISASGRGSYDEHGDAVGMAGIFTDITEQKAHENSLREGEERFRAALRNAPVSVAIQDRDLVFRWAYNQTTVKPEEVIGKTDLDIFTPEDADHLIRLKRRVIETGNDEHVQTWLTMNGQRLFLDVFLRALKDETGEISGVGIATVNLTDVKKTESSLRQSEERLHTALNLMDRLTRGSDVLIAALDTDFRYVYFNEVYRNEILRITGRELSLGMSLINVYEQIPDERENSLKEWQRVMAGGFVQRRIDFGDPAKSGRSYYVIHSPIRDADGVLVGAGEVAYNITDQVKIEYELGETKKYLENLITYANAPIIVWDPETRITRFNHAFEHLTGMSAEDVIGQTLDILFPGNNLDEAMDLIRKTMRGDRWESVEIPILHRDGDIRTVLWNSAPIYGSDGETLVSTIAQGRDITDQKQYEEELTRKARDLEAINRLLGQEIANRISTESRLNDTLSLLNASFESTAEGLLVVTREGTIRQYNRNFSMMWNLGKGTMESHEVVTDEIAMQLKDPGSFLASMRDIALHPGGEYFDMLELQDGRIFERFTKPLLTGEEVIGRLWGYRDITDRIMAEKTLVASLKEKEILLREIHHRVKNNLQIISGLLDLTRMRTQDAHTHHILTDMMLKIQTMAQIHTRLYESSQYGTISFEDQIRDQVGLLSAIYSTKSREIVTEIRSSGITLPVDQAVPCALVMNEVLSNAFKHAFRGRGQGSVGVTAEMHDGQILISVRDDGIGLPADLDIHMTKSLGIKLVVTLVETQLKGTVTFRSDNGTEVIITFPSGVSGG